MVDLMVPTVHLCHGAGESKSLPDDVELLVGHLLYESFPLSNRKSTGKVASNSHFSDQNAHLRQARRFSKSLPDDEELLVSHLLYESYRESARAREGEREGEGDRASERKRAGARERER